MRHTYQPTFSAFFRRKPLVLLSSHERWRAIAKNLKLSKRARERLEWIIYYETKAERNASLTCRHFAISRKVFYEWKRRFDPRDFRTLEDRDRAPKRRRKRTITPEEERRVVALRKAHIRWGKEKLAVLYERTYGETISCWKIQYTVKKYRLYFNPRRVALTQQKRRRAQAKKRITELKQQPFSGFLVALDTIVIYWGGLKRYILTAIDHASKLAFARMYTTKSSRSAADFLRRVFYLLDGSMLHALHDNGSEFEKEFQEACAELQLDQYWTRVKTPDDNPINERFNRTLKEEFLDLGNFTPDPVVFNRNLTEWLIEYTFVRPHEALGYETPWSFSQKCARVVPKDRKVLPMYSSYTRS